MPVQGCISDEESTGQFARGAFDMAVDIWNCRVNVWYDASESQYHTPLSSSDTLLGDQRVHNCECVDIFSWVESRLPRTLFCTSKVFETVVAFNEQPMT